MAEFTDIFIANDLEEATRYNVLKQNLPHVTINGLTDYEISALWASLTNSHVKNSHELIFIEIDSDEVLYQLPKAFVEALAALDNEELSTAAAIWAEYEEIHWRRPQAEQKLQALQALAIQAEQIKQQLYLIIA